MVDSRKELADLACGLRTAGYPGAPGANVPQGVRQGARGCDGQRLAKSLKAREMAQVRAPNSTMITTATIMIFHGLSMRSLIMYPLASG